MINYDKNSPIGFFDSGVGGLSVFSRFKEILPYENTIYYGDLKNMPYGNKTQDELLGFTKNILDFFKEKNVKSVVIACNTSSATTYEFFKNSYNFRIYPIIQSSAKIIANTNINKIGVFATSATINTHAYCKEIQKYNPKLSVKEIACPNWTNYVEHGFIESNECLDDIKTKMKEILEFKPDKIVLGCTHYPYLLPVLKRFYNENLFIDPAGIFVDFIKTDLESQNLLNESKDSSEEFYVSANPEDFFNNSKLFYKLKELPIVCK